MLTVHKIFNKNKEVGSDFSVCSQEVSDINIRFEKIRGPTKRLKSTLKIENSLTQLVTSALLTSAHTLADTQIQSYSLTAQYS